MGHDPPDFTLCSSTNQLTADFDVIQILPTLMLVTNVGDRLCWWQFWDVCDWFSNTTLPTISLALHPARPSLPRPKWYRKMYLAQIWHFNVFLGVQTWQVIFANFFLLTTACIGGICIRYPGEIGQRKAFMETRKCIETRIKITKVKLPV